MGYTGILGLEEVFDLKDSSGAIQSVFFKVNDDQYLEFVPGAADNFHLEHLSILTADLKKIGTILEKRGIAPGSPANSADGNTYLAIIDPARSRSACATCRDRSRPNIAAERWAPGV